MMTDVPRILPGLGGVAAVACLAATLTGCSLTPVKDQPVTLSGVRAAVVVSGGTERPATDGAHLRKGDRVRTAPGGSATLTVRDRRVVLGESTDVVVPDGATVSLIGGSLLVDHRHGPGVTVLAGDTTVDRIGDGAVRVQRTFTVLVAALSAPAHVSTATGEDRLVAALYQTSVAGRALPTEAVPLHLRRDAWERAVVADLVADDVRLSGLARGIAGGEALLAEAIGRAAGRDDAARRGFAKRAETLRGEGGSWGVVARLVRTSVLDVGTALAAVLHGVPTEGPATQQPGSDGSHVVAGGTPQPTPERTPDPSPSTSHDPGSHPPTSEPPTSSPPSSQSVVEMLQSAIPTPPALPIVGG
jgi:hypothetical protein